MGIRTPSGQIAGGSDLRSVISLLNAAPVPDPYCIIIQEIRSLCNLCRAYFQNKHVSGNVFSVLIYE